MNKKFFLVLLAVLFVWGIAFAATSGNRLSPGAGEIVEMPYQSDPPKRFRMVRFLGPTTAAAGLAADSIVVWDTTVDDGVTIITTTTSYDSTVAGILVQACLTQDVSGNTAAQDRGKDNWSWLQTYGISQVDLGTSVNGITAGWAMATSNTAGGAGKFVASTSDPALQGYAGFFFDTNTTVAATDQECFVRTE